MRARFSPILLGGLTLSALAAIGVLTNPQEPVISPSKVMTWDCEYPTQKPEALTIACADGGIYLDQIDWSRWDQELAEGTGTYNVNSCEPSCAEGSFSRTEVRIFLSELTPYKGGQYLRTLVFETLNGENLPNSGQSFYQWDLMESAETKGED